MRKEYDVDEDLEDLEEEEIEEAEEIGFFKKAWGFIKQNKKQLAIIALTGLTGTVAGKMFLDGHKIVIEPKELDHHYKDAGWFVGGSPGKGLSIGVSAPNSHPFPGITIEKPYIIRDFTPEQTEHFLEHLEEYRIAVENGETDVETCIF